MHLYEPHTFEWENCWEFQRTSPLEPLSQFCSNFIWSLLRSRERKIAKIVAVYWPRWSPCPYMVKTFKNLLLQNRECLGAKSLHKSSRTRGLPKLLKRLSYVDIWPFHGMVKFASLCICMSPITFVWENCLEFQTTSPLKPLSQICSNFMWSLLMLGEQKNCRNGRGPLTKMAAMPIYGKKPLKIFFSRTEDALGLNICTNHRGKEIYQNC